MRCRKSDVALISSGTVTNTTRKTGGPGFMLYKQRNAYFDNFSICNGD